MTKLTLPMDTCYLTADYQHPAYKKRFGYTHWGWDLGNTDKTAPIHASADGVIVNTGLDNTCGNVVIAQYNNVTDHDGLTRDIIARYLHLSAIMVKAGEPVKRGQVIARMGSTGKLTTGAHLHIEFGSDTRFPSNTPTVKGSNILKGGTSQTAIDPKKLLAIAMGQTLILGYGAYAEKEDIALPAYSEGVDKAQAPDEAKN